MTYFSFKGSKFNSSLWNSASINDFEQI